MVKSSLFAKFTVPVIQDYLILSKKMGGSNGFHGILAFDEMCLIKFFSFEVRKQLLSIKPIKTSSCATGKRTVTGH